MATIFASKNATAQAPVPPVSYRLTVRVMEAAGMTNNGHTFVRLTIRTDTKVQLGVIRQTFNTTAVAPSTRPQWFEVFRLQVQEPERSTAVFEVMRKGLVSSTTVGRAEVRLSELPRSKLEECLLVLTGTHAKGESVLKVSFLASDFGYHRADPAADATAPRRGSLPAVIPPAPVAPPGQVGRCGPQIPPVGHPGDARTTPPPIVPPLPANPAAAQRLTGSPVKFPPPPPASLPPAQPAFMRTESPPPDLVDPRATPPLGHHVTPPGSVLAPPQRMHRDRSGSLFSEGLGESLAALAAPDATATAASFDLIPPTPNPIGTVPFAVPTAFDTPCVWWQLPRDDATGGVGSSAPTSAQPTPSGSSSGFAAITSDDLEAAESIEAAMREQSLAELRRSVKARDHVTKTFAATEDTYSGFASPDGFHGHGAFTCSASRTEYEGEWAAGARHGSGTFRAARGACEYSGEWHADKRHGHGTLKLKGVEYTGSFVEGVPHGAGTVRFGDAASTSGRSLSNVTYVGEISTGVFHGRGTASRTVADDRGRRTETYRGMWRNGAPSGNGVLTVQWASRQSPQPFAPPDASDNVTRDPPAHETYEGEFRDGRRHGTGGYCSAAFTYQGEWFDDAMCGRGLATTSAGASYDGRWADNVPHGIGVVEVPYGVTYRGAFAKGEFRGATTSFGPGCNNKPASCAAAQDTAAVQDGGVTSITLRASAEQQPEVRPQGEGDDSPKLRAVTAEALCALERSDSPVYPPWLLALPLDDDERALLLRERVGCDTLRDLTDDDLKGIGMSLGSRRRLLKHVAANDALLVPPHANDALDASQ